jgi:alpha-ribazole phosphatase
MTGMPKSTIVETRWWWVRHAPVPDGGRIYGQTDLDCDCTDGEVFAAVAGFLPYNAVWVTSGLARAKQTAAAIQAASDGLHAPQSMPAFAALNEQHLGDWQGQERDAFRAAQQITVMDFWLTKGAEKAPGGESFPDLVERVVPVIDTLGREHAGRDIVTVTHGGTIRAAIGYALGGAMALPHAFTIDNCSITVLEHLRHPGGVRPSIWRVGAVNARPWLPRRSA